MYTPPYKITSKTINLISEISSLLERYVIHMEQNDSVRLRKINRMKIIRGSLAIEGNSLSEGQVTALIEGKHVIAPQKEVREADTSIKKQTVKSLFCLFVKLKKMVLETLIHSIASAT